MALTVNNTATPSPCGSLQRLDRSRSWSACFSRVEECLLLDSDADCRFELECVVMALGESQARVAELELQFALAWEIQAVEVQETLDSTRAQLSEAHNADMRRMQDDWSDQVQEMQVLIDEQEIQAVEVQETLDSTRAQLSEAHNADMRQMQDDWSDQVQEMQVLIDELMIDRALNCVLPAQDITVVASRRCAAATRIQSLQRGRTSRRQQAIKRSKSLEAEFGSLLPDERVSNGLQKEASKLSDNVINSEVEAVPPRESVSPSPYVAVLKDLSYSLKLPAFLKRDTPYMGTPYMGVKTVRTHFQGLVGINRSAPGA